MIESKTLCNSSRLARELRIPKKWLIAEADCGRLPCLRVGHQRLFNIDAVRRVLADRAASSPFTETRS